MSNKLNEQFLDYRDPLVISEVLSIARKRKSKQKQINESVYQKNRFILQEIKNIVWISFDDQKSMHDISDEYIITYINDDAAKVKYNKNNIVLYDEENSFEFNDVTRGNTIVFYRSGYNNDILAFFIKELLKQGYLVINDPEMVKLSSDKYLTAETFVKNGIPHPKYTLITKKDVSIDNQKHLKDKLKDIYDKPTDESQYVCKILNGHGGSGVFLCHGKNILSIMQCLFSINGDTKILVQEKEEIKDGDIRVHVINLNGQQVIIDSVMRHHQSDDFRTNQSLGNYASECELTPEQIKLAKEVSKLSGLVWAGIDILPLTNNKNVVLEINGSSGSTVDVNDPDLRKKNAEFFKKIIDTIKELCQI